MAYRFKVAILGDVGVGKTSLALRITGSPLPSLHRETQGVDFHSARLELPGGVRVTLQLWDTGGAQIRAAAAAATDGSSSSSSSMLAKYIYGCQALLLVYDAANPQSLQCLEALMPAIKACYSQPGSAQQQQQHQALPYMALLANKADLAAVGASLGELQQQGAGGWGRADADGWEEGVVVSRTPQDRLAAKYRMFSHRVSALTGDGVAAAAYRIAADLAGIPLSQEEVEVLAGGLLCESSPAGGPPPPASASVSLPPGAVAATPAAAAGGGSGPASKYLQQPLEQGRDRPLLPDPTVPGCSSSGRLGPSPSTSSWARVPSPALPRPASSSSRAASRSPTSMAASGGATATSAALSSSRRMSVAPVDVGEGPVPVRAPLPPAAPGGASNVAGSALGSGAGSGSGAAIPKGAPGGRSRRRAAGAGVVVTVGDDECDDGDERGQQGGHSPAPEAPTALRDEGTLVLQQGGKAAAVLEDAGAGFSTPGWRRWLCC